MFMILLTKNISRHNYWSFLWHTGFLALASSFMDVDTVMPSVLTEFGAQAFYIGLLVTIMLGGSSISQFFFAPYLHNKKFKKKFLLFGINLRIFALSGLAGLFFLQKNLSSHEKIWYVLFIVSIFSFSGAFANISYVDMMGKLILKNKRKSFLSLKQVIYAIGTLISALIAYKIFSIYEPPLLYGILFSMAFIFLLIASLGFWRLKEVESNVDSIKKFVDFIKFIKREIKENYQLRNYLLIISTLGNVLGLMAFLVLFAKENFPTYTSQVGTMLMLKIIGSVAIASGLFYFSKRFKYNILLYSVVLLALSIPILVIFSSSYTFFMVSFFIGGVITTLYLISISGILLEISTIKNRAIYAGAAGVGSIIPAGLSMFNGWLIHAYGFYTFFAVFITIILSSLIFIKKLHCKK